MHLQVFKLSVFIRSKTEAHSKHFCCSRDFFFLPSYIYHRKRLNRSAPKDKTHFFTNTRSVNFYSLVQL